MNWKAAFWDAVIAGSLEMELVRVPRRESGCDKQLELQRVPRRASGCSFTIEQGWKVETSTKEHRVDALVPAGDERRGKLR